MTARRAKGLTFTAARKIVMAFPGVEEGPCYGTPGFRVRGKLLVRLKEDGATLVVKTTFENRDFLLLGRPDLYFITDHYRDYPYILVRLAMSRADELHELIEAAWRQAAPKRLVAQYDAESR